MDVSETINTVIEKVKSEAASWKAKWQIEREWRQETCKEKEELAKNYSNIVYQLGTAKEETNTLKEQVKLLSAPRSVESEKEQDPDVIKNAQVSTVKERAAALASVGEAISRELEKKPEVLNQKVNEPIATLTSMHPTREDALRDLERELINNLIIKI